MSKEKEMRAFEEGMVAGAKPFEEKFQEHTKHMENIGRSIKHQNNCLQEQQNEMLDILEEHDNRLNEMQNPELFDILNLQDNEKIILLGLLLDISDKYKKNKYQEKMLNRLFEVLEIDKNDVHITLEDVDTIESIKVQKILFRTVFEYIYINSDNSCEENYKRYFSLSEKAEECIQNEIKEKINECGQEGIVELYEQNIIKQQKKYPKLEIDIDVDKFEIDYISDLMYEYVDFSDKIFRKESACREAYGGTLYKYIEIRDSYIRNGSSNYVGYKIVDFYKDLIESDTNKIIDYININKFNMDMQDVLDIKDNYKKNIIETFDEQIRNVDACFRLKSIYDYIDRLSIEETTDYIDTLFGGEREVTVYEEGYGYDCTEAVSDMEEELIALINYVSIDIYKLVKSYMDRLSYIVNQINANLQK